MIFELAFEIGIITVLLGLKNKPYYFLMIL